MSDDGANLGEDVVAFGPYRLSRRRRALLRNDEPVALGDRAMDVLLALVGRPGETLSKSELMQLVWPDTFVEETNLRVQVASLRRTLIDENGEPSYVATVAGRGYRFVGTLLDHARWGSKPPPQARRWSLPRVYTSLIGRSAEVRALSEELSRSRLLSIVGLGGVGKTRVAIAVAERAGASFRDGVYFVDFASITDPVLVPSALASALGVAIRIDDPVATLVAKLSGQQLLLVFDNCEHVALEVTELAEAILGQVPDAHILATTREPLRAKGERVRRLAPLAVPMASVTEDEALNAPAVQLFLDRASARSDDFLPLSAEQTGILVEICRRLDGLPLAIELAAGQVDAMSLGDLNKLLGERFLHIGGGDRTAQDRHHTLAAALDWSYGLLPPIEQALLQRLGVFRGSFDLAAATLVAGHRGLGPDSILAGLLSLAPKSLVLVERQSGDTPTRYRLLETTRAYAMQHLRATGTERETRRRHAAYCLSVSSRAEADWDRLDRPDWNEVYGRTVADIRAAIDWALGPEGDVELGLQLILASAPLGVQLSLVDEYRLRVETGLKRIVEGNLGPMLELQFTTAAGHLSQQLRGPVPQVLAAFDRCLELATQLDIPRLKVDAYRGMWVAAFGSANYPLAISHARRQVEFAEAAGDHGSLLQAQRMLAQAYHYRGDHDQALPLAWQVMQDPLTRIPLRDNFPLQVDRRVSLRIILARTQWIRGDQAAAEQSIDECLDLAEADHAISLCHGLALAACPIAYWSGEYDRAEALARQLVDHAALSASPHWQSWGQLYLDALACRQDPTAQPSGWTDFASNPKKLDMLATLDARYATPQTQARVEMGLVGWCAAEVLRARAQQFLDQGDPAAATALLRTAAATAAAQKAANWQKRIDRTLEAVEA